MRLSETPWCNPSHDDQRLHAILHIAKAAGKLIAILEAEGHGGRVGEPTKLDVPKYAADVVGFDLEAAVLERQSQRNPRLEENPSK